MAAVRKALVVHSIGMNFQGREFNTLEILADVGQALDATLMYCKIALNFN